MDFSPEVAALSAWDFARDVLRERLGAVRVTVGEGFRFAAGRSGDVASLGQMGQDLGFDVEERPRVFHRGAPISSSRVREAIAEGDVVLAGELCGRPVRVEGLVVEGEGRGRTLGIPTANLATAGDDAIPGPGVYACHAWLPGSARRSAVVNTGVRPTFGGVLPRVEAHLPGFSGDLYGSVLALDFVGRIRVERRFESVEQSRGSRFVWISPRRRGSWSSRLFSGRLGAMTELSVETREVDGVTLLYPKGFINAHTVRLFEAAFAAAIAERQTQIGRELL